MNKFKISILICALAVPFASAQQPPQKTTADTTVSQPASNAPAPRWKAKIDGEEEHELKQSFSAPNGTTWILASARNTPGEWTDVRLIAVDNAGRETARYDVAQSIPTKNVISFDGVAVLKDGNVAVFVTTASGELMAVTLNSSTGAPITQMRLGRPRGEHHVSKVVPAEEGRLLLVGRLDGRGWLMKLDTDLGIRWEKTLEDEHLTVLFDAAVNPDGSLAAVGGQLLESGTRIWVGSLTAEAQVIARRNFPGLDARIARKDDGYAIVHSVKSQTGWNIFARGYSLAVEEEWAVSLADGLQIPQTFEITSRPRGGWLVTGPKAEQLWLAELQEGGTIAWSYTLPRESTVWERVWNVEAPILANGDVVLPFTLYTVDEQQKQRLVVRVIKLPLHA